MNNGTLIEKKEKKKKQFGLIYKKEWKVEWLGDDFTCIQNKR
jgi:hypothetical protein